MFNKHSFRNLLKILIICVVIFPVFPGLSQVYLSEGFEVGAKPDGWTEEFASGTEPWRYRNGGHSPNDNNWLIPPEQEDITRNPPSAYEGTFNAIFFKQGDNNERTKLITPELNLLGGAAIELSFYLCQIPWTFEGSTGWDVLRVYYKVSESSPWVLLHEYLDPVYDWTQQTLVLPNISSTYYIAFEGQTRWGYGTCIDDITIESKGFEPMWIKDIDFHQPFTNYVPSGSPDVPVMRIDLTVYGNTDTAYLNNIQFTSLNTSDSDIQLNGVRLYSSLTQAFSTENPLGTPTNFVSGIASFNNLDYPIPPGQSYLWLAFDVNLDVTYGDILDVKMAANSIYANGSYYPSSEQSPAGNRTIYKTQYSEDFEGVHNWDLTGEFEVNAPTGNGGSPGNPDPSSAFSGNNVLGTDLTGLGLTPYNYEADLSETSSYRATSPSLDLFYYKNLNIFFQRHLNIEVWDNASVQVSVDDGNTWNNIWENTSYLNDYSWIQQQISIPDEYSRTDQLKIRFQLGPTDGQNNYSGWNIDDIYLTGEFISRDVGISEWIYPLSGSGHSSTDSVTVRIRNYGGAEITDQVPVAYSFDGGATWTVDNMNQNIPVGGSVIFTFPTKVDLSVPGLRPSVLAETRLPGDQYQANDQYSTQIYIVPTYTPPYDEDFETNEGFWRSMGNEIWEYGTPAGSVINSASSGIRSWVTGLSQKYGDIISQKDRTIFEDDFETDRGWTFSGEFERNVPNNMHLPYFAYAGYYCVGTDLSGTGASPYNYENGITPATSYTATSPPFDVRNYSNLKVSYASWIAIQDGDSIKLEVSTDNGASWITIWKNTQGAIMDEDYAFNEVSINDTLSFSSMFRVRFSLYYSKPSGPVAEGWNFDNFSLTGDLINTEEGYLNSPSFDLTGLTNPVLETRLWLETEQSVDGATLFYSLDDGNNWTQVTNSSGFDSYWNWYTGNPVEALGLNGWSGHSNGWITARHLLPAVLINKPNVQFQIKFMANKFNNEYDGIAVDDIRIFEAPFDVGVADILAPVTACELGPNQKFTLRLQNYGVRNMQPGDSIRIGYHIDRSGEIQAGEETLYLTQAFNSGTTHDFNMSSEFDFSISGDYNTDVFTIETDPFFYYQTANDTLSRLIRVNKPVVELGPDISTVRPDTVILRAFSGVTGYDYLWQDNSTDSVYHVNTQGKYYVRVTNDLGCVTSDTIQVTELIADVGVSDLISPLSTCELGSQVPVQVTIQNFGTDTVDINDTIFISREINFDLLQDTLIMPQRIIPGNSMDYTFSENYDFSAPGVYQMRLYTKYTDDYRTYNDTLEYTLEVYGYPDVDIGNDTVLSAPQYVLTASPGYYSYLWQDGSTLNTFDVVQPGPGQYYVTVSDEHQCETKDTVNVTLNVMDIALERLLSPETSCGLSETITVSIRLRNTGNQTILTGDTLELGYMVDEGIPNIDSIILASDFLPGDSIDYVFAQTTQVVTGEWYDFTVYTHYDADMKSGNDTILMPVGVFETPAVDLGDDYIVVTALEYVLDAGPGFVTYLWQDGSTDQTYTINTPGIHSCNVTVTDGNGCPAYDEVQVMLSVPDIGVTEITHPTTSCELGTDENVQVAITNLGNWDIDQSENIYVSYSINGLTEVTENVALDSTFKSGSTIYYTFIQSEDFSVPAHYDITAYTANGADLIPSNDTIKTSFDVFGNPISDIGNGQDTIVTYQPLTLSVSPIYASYEWQDGSLNPDYEITNPGAGMYSVTVTSEDGCSTLDSVFVAYDLPDIGVTQIVSPVSSCNLGQNTPVSIEIVNNGYYRILTDSAISISYAVNAKDTVTEVINLNSTLQPDSSRILTFASTYDFSATGDYQLDVNLDYGPDNVISNNTLSSTITVWGNPVVEIGGGADTIKASLPVTLDAGTGFNTYNWQDNSSGYIYNVTEFGLYWVTVTDDNGCADTDSVYVYSPDQINDLHTFPGEIKIYPNPVQDYLHVVLNMEVARFITLELYNIQNQLLYREDLKQIQQVDDVINMQWIKSGIYFLRITADKIPYTVIIIVE